MLCEDQSFNLEKSKCLCPLFSLCYSRVILSNISVIFLHVYVTSFLKRIYFLFLFL